MPKKLSKKELLGQIKKAGYSKAGPFMSSPSEFIKDYYGGGDQLKEELASAKAYSEGEMGSRDWRGKKKRVDYLEEKDIEGRMYEDIPTYVDPRYGASYTPSKRKVTTGGVREADIDLHNTAYYLDKLGDKDLTKAETDRLLKMFINLRFNEYEDFGDMVEKGKTPKGSSLDEVKEGIIASGIEHEMGHHVYRPEKTQYPVSTELKRSYFDKKSELFQSLGKFQREYFKETGERLTEPKELYNLIKSDEDFDYLSKEGKRLINYLRKEEKGNKGEEVLKFISELAPMFVANDRESFSDSVMNRST